MQSVSVLLTEGIFLPLHFIGIDISSLPLLYDGSYYFLFDFPLLVPRLVVFWTQNAMNDDPEGHKKILLDV